MYCSSSAGPGKEKEIRDVVHLATPTKFLTVSNSGGGGHYPYTRPYEREMGMVEQIINAGLFCALLRDRRALPRVGTNVRRNERMGGRGMGFDHPERSSRI